MTVQAAHAIVAVAGQVSLLVDDGAWNTQSRHERLGGRWQLVTRERLGKFGAGRFSHWKETGRHCMEDYPDSVCKPHGAGERKACMWALTGWVELVRHAAVAGGG